MTTILLADDHRVVREGLRTLLSQEADLSVVGEASDGRQVVDLARGQTFPATAALEEACEQIRKHMAGCPDCRVVLKTLKKTIALCRQSPTRQPSRAALTRVLSAIKRELARSRPSS